MNRKLKTESNKRSTLRRDAVQANRPFLNDVVSLISSSCKYVSFHTKEYIYESLDDLNEHERDSLKELLIIGSEEPNAENEYSSGVIMFVNLRTFWTEAELRKKGEEKDIVFDALKELIQKQPVKKDTHPGFVITALFGFLYSFLAIETLQYFNIKAPYWLLSITVLFFLGSHILVISEVIEPKLIQLSEKRGIGYFIQKNSGDLFKLLVAAILGGFFTALFAFLIK